MADQLESRVWSIKTAPFSMTLNVNVTKRRAVSLWQLSFLLPTPVRFEDIALGSSGTQHMKVTIKILESMAS